MSARPSIKLTVGKKKPPVEEPKGSPGELPETTPGEALQRKITLKIGPRKSVEDSPAEKKKKKRPPKGQATSKKRRADPSEIEAEPAPAAEGQPGPKRLKLNPSKKPGVQSIRIKNKGLVPNRPLGVGYDSEASDIEIDPSIEEQFVLRMVPGEDCEYLRQIINERRFDRSEISFKPLTREGRRAVLRVRDRQYAAMLVDLPCIIEAMKSWDRRGWYKSADICQMLLVLGPIKAETEAMEYPLPKDVDVLDEMTFQYSHGLTPPLKYMRKRRFRDRISTRTIEQVEREVTDLIAKDESAIALPKYELIDIGQLSRAEGMVQSGHYDEEYDDTQDAEGEVEEYTQAVEGQGTDAFEDDLAAEMEAALAAGADEDARTDSAPIIHQTGTPSASKLASTPGDTSGDDSDESEAEANIDPEAGLDEEQLEQQQQFQQQREEIAELEALIKRETIKWESMANPILKRKLGKRVQDLKQDLALKKVSIGESQDVDA
jgi:transcription initiation factor TFIID subunit 7